MLLQRFSCLCYLACQGLPLRDEKDTNFKQLSRFRAEDNPAFAKWLKEKNMSYTSREIQKEILKDMSLSILRDVVNCTKKSDFFNIMVDESSDVSNREQVAFCLRWVDEDLHSHEDFISLYEMEKTDATTMVNVIKDIFLRLGLDKAKLRGQCYDGCSTMEGKKKGVATLIKRDVQALALSTHCYTYSLDLAYGHWIKNFTAISNSLYTSYEITKLVKFSPKRNSHLRKIHEEEYYENEEKLNGKMQTMRLFSHTRWTVRASSLTSICENYKELEELWNWCLIEYKDRETKARIHGVQAQMQTFDYFFGLRLGILLLRHRPEQVVAS